jgi:hypothetical protein
MPWMGGERLLETVEDRIEWKTPTPPRNYRG